MTKRILQAIVILAVMLASFASTGGASAWSNCPNYITVQWGDTLSGIAVKCGVTMYAIRAANPGLGWRLFAGQVLYIPGGTSSGSSSSGSTYTVQWGDTLAKIAVRYGVRVADILAVNPQIQNASLIYAGQVINLPTGTYNPPPTPPPGNNCNCPPPVGSFATLKITYGPGIFVRSAPGGPIVASAMDKTTWFYNLNTVYMDKNYKVWAEVKLFPPVKGFTTGWILVRDQFGKFFTEPHISK